MYFNFAEKKIKEKSQNLVELNNKDILSAKQVNDLYNSEIIPFSHTIKTVLIDNKDKSTNAPIFVFALLNLLHQQSKQILEKKQYRKAGQEMSLITKKKN